MMKKMKGGGMQRMMRGLGGLGGGPGGGMPPGMAALTARKAVTLHLFSLRCLLYSPRSFCGGHAIWPH